MIKFIYLFDPLCGWCYASSVGIGELAKAYPVDVYATGLFANTGKMIDAPFAQHAWSNDTRISQLTGLPFSQKYRDEILLKGGAFNSFALTMACYLLKQNRPDELLPTLSKLQKIRYVDGLDTSHLDIVKTALIDFGQEAIASQMNNDDVIKQTNDWIKQGQTLAHQFQINGVPSLIAHINDKFINIPSQLLYQDSQNIAVNIQKFLTNL